MSRRMSLLFRAELRRQLNLNTLTIGLLGLLLATLTVFAAGVRLPLDAVSMLMQILGLVAPIVTVLVGGGMVANDIKDGWLRTLLVRPITREEYLLTKIAALFCVSWIMIVPATLVPFVVRLATVTEVAGAPWTTYAGALACSLGSSLTYLSILALFSCWVPGFINIAGLAAWGFGASMVEVYIRFKHGSIVWAQFVAEYLFPNGFSSAADAILSGNVSPMIDLLWGIGALIAILVLALRRITSIPVEGGTL